MRILITGGAGFQGRHLAHYWASEHDVTILNTPSCRALESVRQLSSQWPSTTPLSVIWGSVTDSHIVERAVVEKDCVVHLAAEANPDSTIERPRRGFEANAVGTLNVLEAVRGVAKASLTPLRVIVGSSCEVYGAPILPHDHDRLHCGTCNCNGDLSEYAQDEDAPLRPSTPYAASKAAADCLARAYRATYGLDIVVVRPCNVFGPWQRDGAYGGVIPNFVSAALDDRPLVVRGGQQSREYMFIDDVIWAYDLVLKGSDLALAYNFGSGQVVTIKAIAEMVIDRVGLGKIEMAPARLGDPMTFRIDSSLARTKFGWDPTHTVTFSEGLSAYIRWRLKQRGH